ncbi:cyclic nucleotide-binding domain-containing protein [Melittangium boletus]|uniref:cyclic nucleotide-binding domain-containing protein n=2 Tax=Melittangium TaxID=44 RepID=UPI003DA376D6|nr:cyclic nucleotide-binding domain-containing protein [Archangium primigenium]
MSLHTDEYEADPVMRQRALVGRIASRGRVDHALSELRRLEQLGTPGEAIAVCEALARHWAQGSQLLRSIVMCKHLAWLEPGHTRTQAFIATLYARYPGSASEEGDGRVLDDLELLLPEREDSVAVPLFSMLSQEAFVALVDAVEVRHQGVGLPMMREGDMGASMFFLVEGKADVLRMLEGRGAPAQAVGEGGVFGELTLIAEGPRRASVIPSTPSVFLELSRARLSALAEKHPLVERVVRGFCRKRAADQMLRAHAIFSSLRLAQRRSLSREFELCHARAGEALLTAGQKGEGLYLLLRGRCTPYGVREGGQEIPLAVLREGDVFGEISLLLDTPVTATVRADVDSVLLRLSRPAFERHIATQPDLREALTRLASERMQSTARLLSAR